MLDFTAPQAPAAAPSPGGGGPGGLKKLMGYLFYGPKYGGMMDEQADFEMLRDIAGQDLERNQAVGALVQELARNQELDYSGLASGVMEAFAANPLPEVDPSQFKTSGGLQKLLSRRGGGETKTLLGLLTRAAGARESTVDREDRQAHSLLTLKGKKDKFASVIKTDSFGDIPFNYEPNTGNPREVDDQKFDIGLITAIRTSATPEDQARWLNEDNTFTEEGKTYKQRARDLYKFKQVKEIRDAGIVAALEASGGTEGKIVDSPSQQNAENLSEEMAEETAADPSLNSFEYSLRVWLLSYWKTLTLIRLTLSTPRWSQSPLPRKLARILRRFWQCLWHF